MKNKRKKCYNCKFAGNQFKLSGLTHLHCENPKQYNQEKWDKGEFDSWDTVRVFYDTCNNHEFKELKIKEDKL